MPLSTKLNRISEMAKQEPKIAFRTLAHLINEESLTDAFHELRKDAAAGVDKVTAKEYGGLLQDNIKNLHQRIREHPDNLGLHSDRRAHRPSGTAVQVPLVSRSAREDDKALLSFS